VHSTTRERSRTSERRNEIAAATATVMWPEVTRVRVRAVAGVFHAGRLAGRQAAHQRLDAIAASNIASPTIELSRANQS